MKAETKVCCREYADFAKNLFCLLNRMNSPMIIDLQDANHNLQGYICLKTTCMDALTEILEMIQHKSIVYEKIAFSAPWGIELPEDNNSQFWRLIKGNCYIMVPGQSLIQMEEGDIVFVPNGSLHWIADNPASKRISAAEFLKARDTGHLMFSGMKDRTVMVGGHFEFDSKPRHPFLRDLPKLIHIRNLEMNVNNWLKIANDLIFNELNDEQPGSRIMINRLADIAFIYIIRAYLKQSENNRGFLSALKDERVSSVLEIIQRSPEKNWTLAQLSKHAGMSRSSFCVIFKNLVGETPIEYLTNWRIMKAKQILIMSKEKVSQIACQVGYQSEAAFTRIFKQKVNQTPSGFRNEHYIVAK